MTKSEIKAARERIARYREVPYGACRFVTEQFKVTLDKFQEQTLMAWVDPTQQRISLQAAAGVGKSAVMAWSALHFMAVCVYDEYALPKGLVTGVTADNVKNNFWAEIRRWQSMSDWLREAFVHESERFYAKEAPEQWALSRRTWPKGGSPDEQGATLSGLHSVSVASFIDESGNIPPTVLRAAEQALADNPRFGKIIQAGNPISLSGMLYAAAVKLRDQWAVIKVTNDPTDANRAQRGDIEWAKKQIAQYGRENPWVQSYILGQFPAEAMTALLSITDIERAMERHYDPRDVALAQRRIGVDAARFGDDKWVLFPRAGLVAYNPVDMRNPRSHEVAARVALAKARFGSEREYFDDTGGFSAGAIDALIQAGHSPYPVNFSGRADDARYLNKRAEMWFRMSEWVKRGGALPPGAAELVDELITPEFTYVGGKFAIEPKENIKKRLGRSPNYADALALTFAEAEAPAGAGRVGKAITEAVEESHGRAVIDDYERAA